MKFRYYLKIASGILGHQDHGYVLPIITSTGKNKQNFEKITTTYYVGI